MFSKNKKIIIIISASLLLAVLVFLNLKNKEKETQKNVSYAHHGQISSISLNDVRIDAYYFVPRDATSKLNVNWKSLLENSLAETKNFYESQTNKRIKINYQIYPDVVVGRQDTLFYDGGDTRNGNPQALLSVKSEIEARIKDSLGFPSTQGSYRAVAILYEGVGASAMVLMDKQPKVQSQSHVVAVADNQAPAFLVSEGFLSGSSYKDYGVTVFAHEFGHILGLEDTYEPTSAVITNDIMGFGRTRPINYTYIAPENLKLLGIEDYED